MWVSVAERERVVTDRRAVVAGTVFGAVVFAFAFAFFTGLAFLVDVCLSNLRGGLPFPAWGFGAVVGGIAGTVAGRVTVSASRRIVAADGTDATGALDIARRNYRLSAERADTTNTAAAVVQRWDHDLLVGGDLLSDEGLSDGSA